MVPHLELQSLGPAFPGNRRGLVAGTESRRGRLGESSLWVEEHVSESRQPVHDVVPSPMPPRFLQTPRPLRSYVREGGVQGDLDEGTGTRR